MEQVKIRQAHFADNFLAWIVLRHFLSTSLLRELSDAMVVYMSSNTLQLSDLFSEVLDTSPVSTRSWAITPKPVSDPLAQYLQSRIRSFVWKNDEQIYTDLKGDGAISNISPHEIEAAAKLGTVDLALSNGDFDLIRQTTTQRSFSIFLHVLELAQNFEQAAKDPQFLEKILSSLAELETPLSGVAMKHFGDLFADMDDWEKASVMYRSTSTSLAKCSNPAWSEMHSSIAAMTAQSLANAEWVLQGIDEAAALYDLSSTEHGNVDAWLFSANSSHEALVARSSWKNGFPNDERTSILLAPLLVATHDLEAPLGSWLNEDYEKAYRQFWAILRRQMALGSGWESRITKAFYARCLLAGLMKEFKNRPNAALFRLAIRLAIESGDSKAASRIEWEKTTVNLHVDLESVHAFIQHAETYEGVRLERLSVLIELFSAWAVHLAEDKSEAAKAILSKLADIATKNLASFESSKDVGVKSLKALEKIGERRREWRKIASEDIVQAAIAHFEGEAWWTGVAAAADTAAIYAGAFSASNLRAITEASVLLLEKIQPSDNFWVIVRPLQELLMSPSIVKFIHTDSKLEERMLKQILRFGLEQENAQARMMFHLRMFDSNLLQDKELGESLTSAIEKIQERATDINASYVIENIHALLNASTFSGLHGVKIAIEGLTKILCSADEGRASIMLSQAFSPLLSLANEQERIATSIGISHAEFQDLLSPFISLLHRFWTVAKERPTLFTSFSIPTSNTPNPVLVHNWTFVSIQFSRSLGHEAAIQDAISLAASTQPVLAPFIERARAIRSMLEPIYELDPIAIRDESRETFYLNLGRRLSEVSINSEDKARTFCKALLEMCLRHGPHDLDMSIFAIANQFRLAIDNGDLHLIGYVQRLENDSDRRLNFAPMLRLLGYRNEVDELS